MSQSQLVKDREPIAGPGITTSRQTIADAIGVTRSAIWQVEMKALKKIRQELEKQGFDSASFFDT